MLTAGVLGGMGPAATIDFMARVLARSGAASDQANIHLIVDSNPHVPDRNAAVAGEGPSPAAALAAMARVLERAGADFLVMPCNAAHAFADAVAGATPLPFLNMIEATRDAVLRDWPRVRAVGVIASSGCLDARLYPEAFAGSGVTVTEPDAADRAAFMALLYRFKGGVSAPEDRALIRDIAARLADRGAELLIAACTEVPLLVSEDALPLPMLASTDALADATIAYARRESP